MTNSTKTAIKTDLLRLNVNSPDAAKLMFVRDTLEDKLMVLSAITRGDYIDYLTAPGPRNHVFHDDGDCVREHYEDGSHTLFVRHPFGWIELIACYPEIEGLEV